MKMVNRYKECWGLSLFKWGRYKIEIWYAPRGFKIEKHKHPNQDIRLYFIFGHGTTFYRQRDTANESIVAERTIAWWNIGARFNILRGDYHWFTVSRFPLIFMNIEKWYIKPTSASEDFEYYAK